MSNIYIQEPPTNGKVCLETSVGDIEIELWSRECPKACRNFVQLCLENYYNKTKFHRVVKEFIVQGGDPGNGNLILYYRSRNEHVKHQFIVIFDLNKNQTVLNASRWRIHIWASIQR